jgi:hypothetical protein
MPKISRAEGGRLQRVVSLQFDTYPLIARNCDKIVKIYIPVDMIFNVNYLAMSYFLSL